MGNLAISFPFDPVHLLPMLFGLITALCIAIKNRIQANSTQCFILRLPVVTLFFLLQCIIFLTLFLENPSVTSLVLGTLSYILCFMFSILLLPGTQPQSATQIKPSSPRRIEPTVGRHKPNVGQESGLWSKELERLDTDENNEESHSDVDN